MQNYYLLCFILLLLGAFALYGCSDKNRAGTAYNETYKPMSELLEEKQIDQKKFEVFLRAFKQEQELELWAKNQTEAGFQHIKTYAFCTTSGQLGPKRKEGDRQIPEGVYHIDRFNPQSSFYLSLGLNYPNQSDKILGDPSAPGSDIFIHGGCASVGCIPITNPLIKEVYTLADQARIKGQSKIEVHIFPARFSQTSIENLIGNDAKFEKHRNFWGQLLPIYQHFEQTKQLPKVSVGAGGAYSIAE